jgi:hypothetical protein
MTPEELNAIEARANVNCTCKLCKDIRAAAAEIRRLQALSESQAKALDMMERGAL